MIDKPGGYPLSLRVILFENGLRRTFPPSSTRCPPRSIGFPSSRLKSFLCMTTSPFWRTFKTAYPSPDFIQLSSWRSPVIELLPSRFKKRGVRCTPLRALRSLRTLRTLKQGSYPFSETIFQDFSRTQIDFSRTQKFILKFHSKDLNINFPYCPPNLCDVSSKNLVLK